MELPTYKSPRHESTVSPPTDFQRTDSINQQTSAVGPFPTPSFTQRTSFESNQTEPAALLLRHGMTRSAASQDGWSHGSDISHGHKSDQEKSLHEQRLRQKSDLAGSLEMPVNAVMSAATAMHNLPRLYGDQTVRENKKVTGIVSGLKEASKELGYGFYDGFTGLVTMPLRGAATDGPVGCAKGLVQGSIGVLVKPIAGVSGLAGYTIKGLHRELAKRSVKVEASASCGKSLIECKSTDSFVVHSVKRGRSGQRPVEDAQERSSFRERDGEATRYVAYRKPSEGQANDEKHITQPTFTGPAFETNEHSQDDPSPPYEALESSVSGYEPRWSWNQNDDQSRKSSHFQTFNPVVNLEAATGTSDEEKSTSCAEQTSEQSSHRQTFPAIRDSVRVATDDRYSAVLEQGRSVAITRHVQGSISEQMAEEPYEKQ